MMKNYNFYLLFFLLFTLSLSSYAKDYYWVGGSGKWSELNHWVTTSGGSINHASVPDNVDNIIFDQNSFQSNGNIVELESTASYCLNIDFSQITYSVVLTGTTQLYVFGNFHLSSLMDFSIAGELHFPTASGTNAIIETLGKPMVCKIFFDGNNSSWTVDKLLSSENIILQGYNSKLNVSTNLISSLDILINGINSEILISNNLEVRDLLLSASGSKIKILNNINGSRHIKVLQDACKFECFGTIQCEGWITINSGMFITHDKAINCATFSSTTENPRTITLGNSVLRIQNTFTLNSTNLILTLGNNSKFAFTEPDASMQGSWNINYPDIIFESSTGRAQMASGNCTYKTVETNSNLQFTGESNYFSEFKFNNNGIINGSNQFNQLTLHSGKEYILKSGSVQTIMDNLIATGNCKEKIFIHSSEVNSHSTISKITGTCNSDYALIKDIHAIGGAIFQASNSADLGNNTGWSINSPLIQNLYWVGGSGNWNDVAHWSLSSGGIGGACLPGPNDNVIFNNQSFFANDIVEVTSEQIFCRTLDWSQCTLISPTFTSPLNTSLYIFASMLLSPNMNYDFQGNIHFSATTQTHQINSANKILKNDIYFSGINGKWQLEANLDLGNKYSYFLINGNLNLNSKTLHGQDFIIKKTIFQNELNISNSILNLEGNWSFESDNTQFISLLSTINLNNESAACNLGTGLQYNNINFTSPFGNTSISGVSNIINQLIINTKNVISISECLVNTLQCMLKIEFRGKNNVISDASFFEECFFYEENEFIKLLLSANKNYTIKALTKLKVRNDLICNGTCNGYIYLQSSDEFNQAILSKTNGTIQGEYLFIKGIQAISPLNPAVANASFDLGNNTGWQFTVPASRTVYWVNGGGSWHDSNHWSIVSGGVSGECIPSNSDQVIFDENSFVNSNEMINIADHAYCKSINMSLLDKTENIYLTTDKTLRVSGDFILSDKLVNQLRGTIQFVSSASNTQINTFNQEIYSTVYFKNQTGKWFLNNSFSTTGDILLIDGTLNTQNHSLSSTNLISNPEHEVILNAGNSEILIKNNFKIAGNTKPDFKYATISFQYDGLFENKTNGNYEFNKLIFNGINGTIQNTNGFPTIFDSIIFNKATIFTENCQIKYIKTNEWPSAFNGNFNKIDQFISEKGIDFCGNNNIIQYVIFKNTSILSGSNEFKKAVFIKDGYINGNHTFNVLKFSPDRLYFLEAGSTQIIIDTLDSQGNNCFKLQIQSNMDGYKANIRKETGSVAGYALRLKDIVALGNAKFYAGGESQNILNSSTGWILGNKPGYIYGLMNDSIYLQGEHAIIDTRNFNGDDNTTYLWSNSSNGKSFTAQNTEKIWVKAIYATSPLCYFTDTVNIYFAKITQPTCNTSTNGKIEITGNLSSANKTSWSNGNTGSSISSLSKGLYTANISDKFMLSNAKRTFEIKAPDELKISFFDIKNVDCFNSKNGSLKIRTNGGSKPHSYSINNSPYIQDSVFKNLPANTWLKFRSEDINSCYSKTDSIQLNQPMELTYKLLISSPVTCFDLNNGKAKITNLKGTAPFHYQWNTTPVSTDSMADNLKPNIFYRVKIKDGSNCNEKIDSIMLPNPSLLKSSIIIQKPILCFGSKTGEAKVQVEGGIKPYSFQWSNASIDSTVSQLKANEFYKVKITDAYQCQTIEDSISLTQPTALSYYFKQKPATCQYSTDGEAELHIQGGTSPYFYEWKNLGKNNIVKNLTAQNYYPVKATDKNNCSIIEDSVLITSLSKIDIQENIIHNISTCYGDKFGKIKLTAISTQGIVNYTLDKSEKNTNGFFDNLSGGNHFVEISDTLGCTLLQQMEIQQPEKIWIQTELKNQSCYGANTGIISLRISGGMPNYTVNINNKSISDFDNISNLAAGKYTIDVKDMNNCNELDSFFIQIVNCDMDLNIPNAFTPNNDGSNDVLKIKSKLLLEMNMKIYNRWGKMVYEIPKIDQVWDGMEHNQLAAPGTYFYIFSGTAITGEKLFRKGYIELIR